MVSLLNSVCASVREFVWADGLTSGQTDVCISGCICMYVYVCVCAVSKGRTHCIQADAHPVNDFLSFPKEFQLIQPPSTVNA
jgi:hypothetical protein